MSDWDGRPQNPERDGWHWLLDGNHEPYLLQWSGDNQRWGDYPGTSAADLAEFGIGYLGLCLTPAEVEARIEAARREEREANAQIADAEKRNTDWYPTNPPMSVAAHAIADAIRARGDA